MASERIMNERIEQERARFEAWAEGRNIDTRRSGLFGLTCYDSLTTNFAWVGWLAALGLEE